MHCNNGSEHLHSCLVCSNFNASYSQVIALFIASSPPLCFIFLLATNILDILSSVIALWHSVKTSNITLFRSKFFLLQIWLVSWNSDSNQDLCIPLPLRQSGSSPLFDQIWIALSWQPNPTGNVYFCICVIDQDSFIMTAKFMLTHRPPPPSWTQIHDLDG